jgi:hypothetical protein
VNFQFETVLYKLLYKIDSLVIKGPFLSHWWHPCMGAMGETVGATRPPGSIAMCKWLVVQHVFEAAGFALNF